MTDSKTYNIRGAEVIVTASVFPRTLDVSITVDLAPLDKAEPDHSSHNLVSYFNLPGYRAGQEYWWRKVHHKVTVRTGAQAQRVIRPALAKIDDAVQQAVIDRAARKQHLTDVFP